MRGTGAGGIPPQLLGGVQRKGENLSAHSRLAQEGSQSALCLRCATPYLDFIDRFEADSVEALQPVCAPFTEAEDYSWFIYVREQMVERYGTAEQMEEYRRQAELRGTPECKAKTHMRTPARC